MDSNYYRQYEPLFGAWYIKEKIGEGSFGQVFVVERREFGRVQRSALKAVTIPKSQREIESLRGDGLSDDSIKEYYRGIINDIINEYDLMSQLKGNSNIVSYEDHMLKPHEDGFGWDILIRMELLETIDDYFAEKEGEISVEEVVRFGIDMCNAIDLCEKKKIVHRDIKPENIFVSETGNYKLGDFGVAETLGKAQVGSKKGTYNYMAPEVYKGENYGLTVDIYSLGIVMYRMLNDNRTPFLPPYPEPIRYSDKEKALLRRINGESLPPPKNGGEKLTAVILKACAYEVKDRYQSSTEMRTALMGALREVVNDETKSIAKKIIEKIKIEINKKTSQRNNAAEAKAKGWTHVKIITGIAIVTVAIAAIIYACMPKEVIDIMGIEKNVPIKIGDSISPEYKIEPEFFAKKKITFEIKDKDVATVDETGKIIAKKVGETELKMSVKNFEKKIQIKVKKKITSVTGVDTNIRMLKGETIELKPELHPAKYADEEIRYKTSDNTVAKINKSGKITAVGAGVATIKINVGGYTKKIEIEVYI